MDKRSYGPIEDDLIQANRVISSVEDLNRAITIALQQGKPLFCQLSDDIYLDQPITHPLELKGLYIDGSGQYGIYANTPLDNAFQIDSTNPFSIKSAKIGAGSFSLASVIKSSIDETQDLVVTLDDIDLIDVDYLTFQVQSEGATYRKCTFTNIRCQRTVAGTFTNLVGTSKIKYGKFESIIGACKLEMTQDDSAFNGSINNQFNMLKIDGLLSTKHGTQNTMLDICIATGGSIQTHSTDTIHNVRSLTANGDAEAYRDNQIPSKTIIDGAIKASGAIVTGSVGISGSTDVIGNVAITGSFGVNGNSNFNNVAITGTLGVSGKIVIGDDITALSMNADTANFSSISIADNIDNQGNMNIDGNTVIHKIIQTGSFFTDGNVNTVNLYANNHVQFTGSLFAKPFTVYPGITVTGSNPGIKVTTSFIPFQIQIGCTGSLRLTRPVSDGQQLVLLCTVNGAAANNLFMGKNFTGSVAGYWFPAANGVVELIGVNGEWYEKTRSNNTT